MLDLAGAVFAQAAFAVILISVASTLTPRLGQRIGLAAIAGDWAGLAVATTAAGALENAARGAIALLVLFSTPLAATAILAALSATARRALLVLPPTFFVPFYLIVHAVIFAKLRAEETAA